MYVLNPASAQYNWHQLLLESQDTADHDVVMLQCPARGEEQSEHPETCWPQQQSAISQLPGELSVLTLLTGLNILTWMCADEQAEAH